MRFLKIKLCFYCVFIVGPTQPELALEALEQFDDDVLYVNLTLPIISKGEPMKHILMIAVLGLVFTVGARAQGCVSCVVEPNPNPQGFCLCCGWGVEGAWATDCYDVGCVECTAVGSCGINMKPINNDPLFKLRFDPSTIRQIAMQHSRLAATLAVINRRGEQASSSLVSWLPVEMTPDDVELWLKPDITREKSFSYFKERTSRLALKKFSVARYSITVSIPNNIQNTDTLAIKIQPLVAAPMDPTFHSMDVVMQGGPVWTIKSWKINGLSAIQASLGQQDKHSSKTKHNSLATYDKKSAVNR